jgi:hypothetical protein
MVYAALEMAEGRSVAFAAWRETNHAGVIEFLKAVLLGISEA